MEKHDPDALWNKYFNVDSQTGTGRFIMLIVAFVLIGGFLVWLIG